MNCDTDLAGTKYQQSTATYERHGNSREAPQIQRSAPVGQLMDVKSPSNVMSARKRECCELSLIWALVDIDEKSPIRKVQCLFFPLTPSHILLV